MKKIVIISGDPNSINSEILYKSWKKLGNNLKKKIYIISNYKLIKKQFKKLGYSPKMIEVNKLNEDIKSNQIKIINVKINFKNPFKVRNILASRFIDESLSLGHKHALRKDVKGIINCPINKNLLKKGNVGVTEYFASKCKLKKDTEVMLIRTDKFSISPLTTHINVKDISKKINKKIIYNKIKTIDKWFKRYFKRRPKIGILGLNPHNAEFKKESEEVKIIIPSIKKLRKIGINLVGPLVADTIFINDYKKFDVIVGMYHDQVLTPIKTIYKFNAINVTLGLKYLRVSPDHGTATPLIGKNKANPISLINCINFINKFGK